MWRTDVWQAESAEHNLVMRTFLKVNIAVNSVTMLCTLAQIERLCVYIVQRILMLVCLQKQSFKIRSCMSKKPRSLFILEDPNDDVGVMKHGLIYKELKPVIHLERADGDKTDGLKSSNSCSLRTTRTPRVLSLLIHSVLVTDTNGTLNIKSSSAIAERPRCRVG